MAQYAIKYGARATHKFGSATQDGVHPTMRADCPLQWCKRESVLLTESGKFQWHSDKFGFVCDATGLSLKEASNLQIDEHGRVINGRDEFEKITLTRAQAK